MRFQLIRAEEANFSTAAMCSAAGVSRSGYYAWRCREPSNRAKEDEELLAIAKVVHRESRRAYGYPRVHRELREKGRRVGRHRVARLMRANGLRGRFHRRYVSTTKADERHSVVPNILNRNFDVEEPNAVWVGDTTFIHTREGWLYLAILVDLFSRKIVGWATSDRNSQTLVLAAWRQALAVRRAPRLHHTDRGSTYTS